MSKKLMIFAGIIGRYPVGGVTWCALHYISGFQRLGYDVFYLEDTGQCGFDPIINGINTDPSYALRYINKVLKIVGIEDSWAYIDHTGRYHGKSREKVREICHEAELMVNLSGGCWFARQEFESIRKIFIDTDPGFTQRNILENPGWDPKSMTGFASYSELFSSYNTLFTFALNVNNPNCKIPYTPFHWHPTIQPLALEFWPIVPAPPQAPYTTILSWRNDSFQGMGKGKGGEIYKLINLPSKTSQQILLAISGRPPTNLLTKNGWQITDAVKATIDPIAYRTFIQNSKAELGFAKSMYIETRSGWFSDRTQCYLASGRPALVHDTGFSDFLPCGEGLLKFSNVQEIRAGIYEIEQDYFRHSLRAREIAEEYFAAEKVLRKLMKETGI